MKTIKSLSFALAMPVLLTYLFSVNVITTKPASRAPAVEKSVKAPKTLKASIESYIVAVNK